MYGLLLESIYHYIRTVFGEETLLKIREKANLTHTSFSAHQVYSETVIPRLARAAEDVTGMPIDELMESFGITFVTYVSRYGHDSYPKIKPPSFFVTDETVYGLTLHYRSRRKFFKSYVKGQVRQVGKKFYNTDVKCEEIDVGEVQGMSYCTMKLTFDNTQLLHQEAKSNASLKDNPAIEKPIPANVFFELFPFHLVLNRDLMITSVGVVIKSVLPNLIGSQLDDLFHISRPLIDFNWDSILCHTNNIFEMQSVDRVENRLADRFGIEDHMEQFFDDMISEYSEHKVYNKHTRLKLRGQMLLMEEWGSLFFLATPVMEDLEEMFKVGLYIADLSIHDSSRELLLAGPQQSAELQLLLDQELTKTKKLESSMKSLDTMMKKTDQLLYQMIPKSVADRLRAGEPSVNTCQVFNICTILFSDVVGFTNICSKITPMQVVTMLNAMYTTFDTLVEKRQLYKVETIGDAYMIAGGVPEYHADHAVNIVEMAIAMLQAIKTHKDPSDETGRVHLRLRIGIHSGTVVAGVVGLKMPRYCLFGDTVNTASRMESMGEAMRIHCSQDTKKCLDHLSCYTFEERGSIEVKGKGSMLTYWLTKNHQFPSPDKIFPSKSRSSAIAKQTTTVRPDDHGCRPPTAEQSIPPSPYFLQSSSWISFEDIQGSNRSLLDGRCNPSTVPFRSRSSSDTLRLDEQTLIGPQSSAQLSKNVYSSRGNLGKSIKNFGLASCSTSDSKTRDRVAAVEPSPIKPFSASITATAQPAWPDKPLSGLGQQKKSQPPVVRGDQGCSSTCQIL
ncbi:soluble guanylate cyclase 88E-like [Watersipora subatra]|uniref:soluble guanylate cyclase 88E-like n=1 Tax=Watersipora subatra TaxID=2589382 RepID=UPI00355C69E1